ncbi:MAG TPA: ATP-binding protein [Syntrophorhabdales bacterium]|nr:ATP-binding protein [Syntrophorhabdales bacterium]
MERKKSYEELLAENEALRPRLEELEETLHAIRNHEVDALMAEGPGGDQVFTLQGAEQPYRVLVETMAEGAATVTPDGVILYANGRLAEMLKASLNKILGASIYDFLVPRNGQTLEAMLFSCDRTGRRGEFLLKAADGEEVPVTLAVRPLSLDGVESFCIVASDLTEQKHAQEALEKARDHLEERVAERTAELSRVNATLQEEISERKRAEEGLKKAHNELERRVEERTAELTRAYGKLETAMAERAKVEQQLLQAQKMEAVGTLAGGIAHDFNNVLAAMIGFSELAADEIPADSTAQHHLKRVHEAGLRARELVKQILAFSRKSEGKRKQISLAPLIHETYALLRSSLPTTIQMPLAITTGDDYVLADSTQLQQVLMNLATNAADAMRKEGGQLTIGLSSVTFPRGSLLPDPDMAPGTYVKLAVKDTGMGMTEDVRQRIFEPFFTTKEIGKGTGMGLAVVYGIVKSHGGAVTVESEVGQGSTFEVFLPRAQKPEIKKEETTTSTLPTGTERILFIDDEELLVEMARNMLESLGYHVTIAKHPTDAWNLFLEDPSQFDLIITDQTMPDTTGLTLAQKMLRVRKEIPIILCTGYSEMVSADKAKEAGICEFIMKPMMKRELAETIRKILDQRKG